MRTRLELELIRLLRQALERALGEAREQRDALQRDDVLAFRARRRHLGATGTERLTLTEQRVGEALTHGRSLAGLRARA